MSGSSLASLVAAFHKRRRRQLAGLQPGLNRSARVGDEFHLVGLVLQRARKPRRGSQRLVGAFKLRMLPECIGRGLLLEGNGSQRPGGALEELLEVLVQSGANISISTFSAKGIQISSTVKYLQ